MNHVKNLINILLLVQFFLFCACNEKKATVYYEEETAIKITEQNKLNLVDFVKCPFDEEFDDKTNLEQYVLKKFGKPDKFGKGRAPLGDASGADIITDKIWLRYDRKYSFIICKGVSKKFEVFDEIYIYNFIDLKYGINEETAIRDIESLFGKPKRIQQKRNDTYSYTIYYYDFDNKDNPYIYFLYFGFRDEKLHSIEIEARILASRL